MRLASFGKSYSIGIVPNNKVGGPKMSKPKKWNRKDPKSSRAGCLLCKPWKANGQKDDTHRNRRKELVNGESG